jgi:hypothetical protein
VLAVGAPGVWTIIGGTPVAPKAGLARSYLAVIGTTGNRVGSNDGKHASFWPVSTMAASHYITLCVGPTTVPYRFLGDDRYVSTADTVSSTTSGPAGQYLLLDFGTHATRKITVEGGSACSLYAAFVENAGRIWPIDLRRAVRVPSRRQLRLWHGRHRARRRRRAVDGRLDGCARARSRSGGTG